MQKKIGFGILVCVFIVTKAFSQNISSERIVDWSNAGVQTNIPEFQRTINILNYGGSNNGTDDNVAAFNSALASATPGTTILFPAGTYHFSNTININKDSIILKGAGTDTRLLFNQNGASRNLIQIAGGRENADRWIKASIPAKQKFVLSDNTASLTSGDWVNLIVNDSSVMYSTWAYKTGGQILQIERISGDTLHFKSEIRRSHDINTSPRLRKINPRKYVGIENLYIERVDNVDAQTTNIFFNYSVNSWIIGVESNMTTFAHASFNSSSNMTLKGSYFHHSHSYGSGGRGYGIVVQYTSGECLVEDNIFNNLRHSVLLQAGANGNVIGYNYSQNPYWTDVFLPANSAGDLVLHGNYVYANLAEGNTMQHIVIDNSHGINGPYNTIFRNKAIGYGIFMNTGAGNSTNVVGNDVTNTGLLMGLYTLTGTDNYQYGNRVKGANNFRPSGSNQLTKESYYLCEAPAWWNAGSWPNAGAPYTYNTPRTPAQNRWTGNSPLSYHTSLRLKHQNQLRTWYKDADGDGFGHPNQSIEDCKNPSGYVSNNLDCNDNDANIHPNTVWYEDKDKDGFHSGNTLTQCTQPEGYVLRSQLTNLSVDCNDANPNVYPGATEICDGIDNNCNGQIDEGLLKTFFRDADGDGFGNPNETTEACSAPQGYVENNTDCNDANPNVYPGATEICDGIDNNCNGQIDEGLLKTFFRDADGDGFGNPNETTEACSAPQGYVENNTDCNDANPNVYPGATEICDGIDNNCNGQIDEGLLKTFFRDADGDGFGNPNETAEACTAPQGYVENNTDCNDTNPNVYPGATEICDGIDNNCNGQVDEGLLKTFFRDADGDGFGNPNETTEACTAPQGYVENNTDCNDTNPNVYPGATEICDGIDNNCNGQIDEGLLKTFFRDADGDGFGNPNETTEACTAPQGYVENNTDCNDTNPNVYPGATEICDSIDNNCNGQIDEGLLKTFFRDADGDGFGNPNETTEACSAPQGYLENNTDCDDTDANIHPEATEIPNDGIDQDCDGEDLIITGIDNKVLFNFKVYPNPNTGAFWLETSELPEDNYQIVITDISGRMIYQKEFNILSHHYKTPLFIEFPGMYIIQLRGSKHYYFENVLIY